MRKEWRRQKKERDSLKKSAETAFRQNQQQHHQQTMLHHSPYSFQPTPTTATSFMPSNMTFGHFY
jgi:predicted nucleotide-binding protein (sugar kinase/HSP70/actin superfamily)